MKKSLLALAIAGAFSGAAFAQSSVTLFGVADTGFTYAKGDGNGNVKGMSVSGLNSSRLGVRGSEDLGSGLKANFWFEMGVNTDSGAGAATNTNNQSTGSSGTGLSFNRRMFVGLSGGFGEVRLGRNYTPIFMQITSNDPFGTNGVGETNIEVLSGLVPGNAVIATTVRASNAVEYLTPPGIGGVYVHGMYAFGENPSTAASATVGTNDGRSAGIRVGWAGGPADVSVAYNKTDYLQLATQGNYTVMGIGGTLTFGAFKPMFQVVKHKIDIANNVAQDPERTDFLVGLVASFGATDLRFAYNRYNLKHVTPNPSTLCATCTNDGAVQYSLGPVYNLSRRTAVYGTYSLVDNKGSGNAFAVQTTAVGGRPAMTPGGKSSGFEVGLRHSF